MVIIKRHGGRDIVLYFKSSPDLRREGAKGLFNSMNVTNFPPDTVDRFGGY